MKLPKLKLRNTDKNIPHNCFTCQWFRENKPGGNRFCKYPGKLNIVGGSCLSWQLEPDPNRRGATHIYVELQNPVQPTTP